MWVVEVDQGGVNWVPIAYAVSEQQAQALAVAPHIVEFGEPVLVRKYGEPAPPRS